MKGVLGPTGQPLIAPHVQRMMEESDQLGQRLAALDDFISSTMAKTIDVLDLHLLKTQHAIMQAYLRILVLRIERASGPKH